MNIKLKPLVIIGLFTLFVLAVPQKASFGDADHHDDDSHHSHDGDENHSHNNDDDHTHSGDNHHTHSGDDHHSHDAQETVMTVVNPDLFLAEGLTTDIREEACTLSGGTETLCYRIKVFSVPTDHEAGPWCPRTVNDTADVAGFWFEDGSVYDLTGEFIVNLAIFYDDDNWRLFNDDGSINVTDTQEAFESAARPNVDEQYQNHCVEGELSYMGEGETLLTYVIPITPVMVDAPLDIQEGGVLGVALNGVNFDPPAPVDNILGAYTIAALDDCGGHVNPASGYHYHAHTGCTEGVEQEDGHAPLVGYALDGVPMFALLDEDGNEPVDLDACRGHYDDVRGYHYHVNEAGSNMTLGCFSAEIGCVTNGDSDLTCDASAPTGGGNGGDTPQRPDFAAAAEALGVSESDLMTALGTQRPPDFAAAAEALGVSEADLRAALGVPPQ